MAAKILNKDLKEKLDQLVRDWPEMKRAHDEALKKASLERKDGVAPPEIKGIDK